MTALYAHRAISTGFTSTPTMSSDAMGFKGARLVSTLFYFLSLTASTGTTFLTYPSVSSAAGGTDRHGVTLIAHPHRVIVTTSYVPSGDNTPGPIPTRLTPVLGTWSPSLPRKIGRGVRQSSPWQKIVSCAFVFATVVFFSALAGIGYVPREPDQLASSWHAPKLGHTSPPSEIHQRILRVAGLWKKRTVMGARDDEDAEEFLQIRLPRVVRKRPRYGLAQA